MASPAEIIRKQVETELNGSVTIVGKNLVFIFKRIHVYVCVSVYATKKVRVKEEFIFYQ